MRIAITAQRIDVLSMRVGHVVERIGDVRADARLGKGTGELLGGRLGRISRDRVERLGQAETAAQAGGHEHEDVGQDPLEGRSPAGWRGVAGRASAAQPQETAANDAHQHAQATGVAHEQEAEEGTSDAGERHA